VVSFETNIAYSLYALIESLSQGTYRVGSYKTFVVHDPKTRQIQALSFKDRVVQHCLCDNILAPYFNARLIYDNAACRQGKGVHFALNRFSNFLRDHYKKHGTQGYILKYDIRHYFASIDHAVLKARLKNFPDARVRDLLYHIIDSYESFEHGHLGAGLPMGNQTSQWFALLYLDPMDRLIKEKWRIKHYVRYMDDGVLVHVSKDYLKEVFAEMQALAKELKLEFNAKTQIFPLSQGVDFLGFRFYVTDTGKVIRRLRTSCKKRFKRRVKKLQKQYKAGEVEAQEIFRVLKSYNGHLKHGHTYRMKKHVYSKLVLQKGE
ncbi:MAG: RNA-directed DNA polymerase, partial [Eggerthellaceae bacterium]|nr:RNA-directed DNA polymerase [Eggerthellaceae bacterium]